MNKNAKKVSELKVVKAPKVEKSLEQQIQEQLQQNRIDYLAALDEAGKKFKCRLAASQITTEQGTRFVLDPVNIQ